jgi:hypothetical protein
MVIRSDISGWIPPDGHLRLSEKVTMSLRLAPDHDQASGLLLGLLELFPQSFRIAHEDSGLVII